MTLIFGILKALHGNNLLLVLLLGQFLMFEMKKAKQAAVE